MITKRSSKPIKPAKRVKDLTITPLQSARAKSIKGGCADGRHVPAVVQKVRE